MWTGDTTLKCVIIFYTYNVLKFNVFVKNVYNLLLKYYSTKAKINYLT